MCRTLWICLVIVVWAAARPCLAQDSEIDLRRDRTTGATPAQVVASGVLTPTPQMWFYEQERSRYEDTRHAIRRRAEARAQQRMDRVAAMAWYGMSNSRPTVSSTPWYGGYSAHWGSNSFDPLRWRPLAAPLVAARPVSTPD